MLLVYLLFCTLTHGFLGLIWQTTSLQNTLLEFLMITLTVFGPSS